MTYYDYINVDLTTGRRLAFTDLFDTEAEIARAAQVINEKSPRSLNGILSTNSHLG